MIKFSDNFILKFMEGTFKDVSPRNFITTIYYYMTDSKYRISKRLDTFLKEQLINPDEELVNVAQDLKSSAKDQDDLIIKILKYVYQRVRYESDWTVFKMTEKWATAHEVWTNRRDDCDGLNTLVYVLARLCGISQSVLWCAIGSTKSGGHFWLIYFSTKYPGWYAIDATYWVNFNKINSRDKFTFSNDKYQSLWYLFNDGKILKQR